MEPMAVGALVFAILFGAAGLGMRLRSALPDHHRSPETKDSVRIAMGLVATMAALVLGLLVASAKGTYDVEKTEVTESVAGIKFLDGVLRDYGPDAQPARDVLRRAVEQALIRLWPEENSQHVPLDPSPYWSTSMRHALMGLTPQTEVQRELKAQALALASHIGQTRWLVSEQAKTPISLALLIVVVAWMAIIFVSLGLFAPDNGTVVTAFGSAALSVAGAMFLILELTRPFSGTVRISSEPLRSAIEQLAR